MKTPKWYVTDVTAYNNYILRVTFITGEIKYFNFAPLLELTMYAPLKNISLFLQAKVSYGIILWNDELDITPEYLYEHSIEKNEFIAEKE